MFKRCLGICGCLLLWSGAIAGAADKVILSHGTPVNGTLVGMSPTEVTVEVGPLQKRVPVNEIKYISFEDEPRELTNGRTAFDGERYGDVAAQLSKIDQTEIKRREIRQDIEFYNAMAAARLALGGAGSKADAGKLLLAFERANAGSYHYLTVCEAVGDLLVSLKSFDKAEPYYAKLAAAPWPDYQARALVLVGRLLQSQNLHDKAIQKFDAALAIGAGGKETEKQRLGATLGKATSLAATGKAPEGIKLVEQVITLADPETDRELHARAYNALGACYKVSGQKKDALLAYLHVDVLYSGYPEQHAEALFNLAQLWGEVDKGDRARQAENTLQQRYPGSRWVQK